MEAISSSQIGNSMPMGVVEPNRQSASAIESKSLSQQNKDIEKSNNKKDVDDLKKELSTLSEQLNKEMSPLNFNVKFGFNDKIDEMYVSVTEKSTNKLIRKIPSDEAVKLMEKMREIVGMIFDKKA